MQVNIPYMDPVGTFATIFFAEWPWPRFAHPHDPRQQKRLPRWNTDHNLMKTFLEDDGNPLG